jgi:hypothetical protein
MTIKKSDFLLNFMMFWLGTTVSRRILDPYLMGHLAAKLADLMLVNLPYSKFAGQGGRFKTEERLRQDF